MTRAFLKMLNDSNKPYLLVDRRFSKSLADVGKTNVSKIVAGLGLILRLAYSLVMARPQAVVFFVTNRPGSFVVDVALSLVLRFTKAPTIAYVHTQGFTALRDRGRLWSVLVKLLFGSVETVVCLSPTLERDIRQVSRRVKITSIANTPPDVPVASPESSRTRNQILFLSNLIEEKGLADFLHVADQFSKAGSRAQFLVAGAPTTDDQLDSLRASVPPNTQIIGAVHPQQKWELLSTCSVLVFPSRYVFEAQPLVIIEAFLVGLPVVTYNVGGISDMITSGHDGVIVEQGDRDGISKAVNRLLGSDEERARMGGEASRTYQLRYSPDAYKKAWNALL
jgi:glycosyltransferase involved in cell wall biosynthesis